MMGDRTSERHLMNQSHQEREENIIDEHIPRVKFGSPDALNACINTEIIDTYIANLEAFNLG